MQYLQTKQQEMLNYAGAVELAHNPVLILSLVLLNFRSIQLLFYNSGNDHILLVNHYSVYIGDI